MPTIAVASSKGGAGKTTVVTVLASELARQGLKKKINVTLIDVDPNQHSAKWVEKDGCPKNIKLIPNINEGSILDAIEQGEKESEFVLIDLEGTASVAVASAISQADLVILPCQGSQDDADEVVKTVKLIRNQERMLKRKIAFSVLMTRTPAAIESRTLKYFIQQFRDAGLDIFKCSLIERDAYKAMRSFGGIVNNLPSKEVYGIEQASANALALTKELLVKLKVASDG